jgi:hypothetical protein
MVNHQLPMLLGDSLNATAYLSVDSLKFGDVGLGVRLVDFMVFRIRGTKGVRCVFRPNDYVGRVEPEVRISLCVMVVVVCFVVMVVVVAPRPEGFYTVRDGNHLAGIRGFQSFYQLLLQIEAIYEYEMSVF